MHFSLSSFALENLVSRDGFETGSAVPSRISPIILHTRAERDVCMCLYHSSKDAENGASAVPYHACSETARSTGEVKAMVKSTRYTMFPRFYNIMVHGWLWMYNITAGVETVRLAVCLRSQTAESPSHHSPNPIEFYGTKQFTKYSNMTSS